MVTSSVRGRRGTDVGPGTVDRQLALWLRLAVEDLRQRLHRDGASGVGGEPGRRGRVRDVVGDLRGDRDDRLAGGQQRFSSVALRGLAGAGCWSARRPVSALRRGRDGGVDLRRVSGLAPVGSAVVVAPRAPMRRRQRAGRRLRPEPVTSAAVGLSRSGSTPPSLRTAVIVRSVIRWAAARFGCRADLRSTFVSSTSGLCRMPRWSFIRRMRSTLWSMRCSVSSPLRTALSTLLIASSRFGGMSSWSTPALRASTGISASVCSLRTPAISSASVIDDAVVAELVAQQAGDDRLGQRGRLAGRVDASAPGCARS